MSEGMMVVHNITSEGEIRSEPLKSAYPGQHNNRSGCAHNNTYIWWYLRLLAYLSSSHRTTLANGLNTYDESLFEHLIRPTDTSTLDGRPARRLHPGCMQHPGAACNPQINRGTRLRVDACMLNDEPVGRSEGVVAHSRWTKYRSFMRRYCHPR